MREVSGANFRGFYLCGNLRGRPWESAAVFALCRGSFARLGVIGIDCIFAFFCGYIVKNKIIFGIGRKEMMGL